MHPLGTWRVMRIRNFLPQDVHAALLAHVLEHAGEIHRLLRAVERSRVSQIERAVSFSPDYEQMFRAALRAANPQICEAIGVPSFTIDHIECQLTATSDRGYFKPHNDNSAGVGHRKVTFVYYFHREAATVRMAGRSGFSTITHWHPTPATPDTCWNCRQCRTRSFFFDASCYHEVRDVLCQTPGFANARFTVNGWIYAGEGEGRAA